MNSELMFSRATPEWETPQAFFDALDAEFHFTLDPCSTDENAKCAKHYTKAQDGLAQDWTGETVYCNPPYGREMPKWIQKCYEHKNRGGGCGYVDSCPDGHKGVSRIHIPQGGDSVCEGAFEVWKRAKQCAVSFDGCSV